MENFFLHELINAAKGEFLLGDPHRLVAAISIDTRTLRKGDFYVAIVGKNFDGHAFIKQAAEKEAGGIMLSRSDVDLGNPFPALPAIVRVQDTAAALGAVAAAYRRKWDIPLTAVTGSNGKTSTKEMLASILRQKGPTLSTSGNFNNQIGLPLTVFSLTSQHRYAVIEMGTSFPGEIERLAAIAQPQVGILTNIGSAHLENFKSREGVLAEKRTLIDALPDGGIAVINVDDPFLNTLVPGLKVRTVTYGMGSACDVHAENIKLWPGRPEFDLRIKGDYVHVQLPVFGKFNIVNALAAAAAAWALGTDIELIKNGLQRFSPPRMRMEHHALSSGAVIVNDAYNANPSSMREALQGLAQSFPDRDKIVVLGDMLELGDAEEAEHRQLGEFLASQPLGQIFLFGPRMAKAREALSASSSARHFSDKEELLQAVQQALTPRCVAFFKGSRGMHLEETVDRLLVQEKA